MNDNALQNKLKKMFPYLNEKQQRILAATEAMSLGYGGISKVSRLTGICRSTIHKGIEDLEIKDYNSLENIRLPGGGRKSTPLRNKKVRKAVYVATLPSGCRTVIIEGVTLHQCGGTYYQPHGNQYVVVNVD